MTQDRFISEQWVSSPLSMWTNPGQQLTGYDSCTQHNRSAIVCKNGLAKATGNEKEGK